MPRAFYIMKNIITQDQFGTFSDNIKRVFHANALDGFLSQSKIDIFFTMSKMLTEFNESTNLTSITDIDGIIRKHIADSLLGAEYFPVGSKVIDIGTGGGFPSLPLAIARPDLNILAVDSTAKKLRFVELASHELGLTGISVKAARAEELIFSDGMRGGFDCVCARAVADLSILAELCIPFLKLGGRFIAYKGSDGAEEANRSRRALELLGCCDIQINEKALSDEYDLCERRCITVCVKTSETPKKYPRKYAQIKSSPL